MCSLEDKLLKLEEHCVWNVLKQVTKYLMFNYTSKAMMIMSQNTRTPVPSTQKRGGGKNHLVKTQNFCKHFLKTKNQKKYLKVNMGMWNEEP